MAAKAANPDQAYADETMFIPNWGAHSAYTMQVSTNLKLQAERIPDQIVQARDKINCFKCTNGQNHLNPMCFIKGEKKQFRVEGSRLRDEDQDNRKGAGFRDRDRAHRELRNNNRDRSH